MYVDESGDSGAPGTAGTTPVFVLTGLVVHELRWHDCLTQLVDFRRWCRAQHGLKLREEIHASRMINKPGGLVRIPRHQRLAILHAYAHRVAGMGELNIINVVVRKEGKGTGYDVFENAWRALIQRFENTLNHRNFRGPANPDDRGMLIPDHSSNERIMRLLRQMRHYNPVPHQPQFGMGYRTLTLAHLVEDPSFSGLEALVLCPVVRSRCLPALPATTAERILQEERGSKLLQYPGSHSLQSGVYPKSAGDREPMTPN